MFGYVRPLKGELKVAEYEMFRATYCGLCHTLGRRYGRFAQMSLNYDLAFFAAAIEGLRGGVSYEHHKCMASPFRKKCMTCTSDGQNLAADLTVVLTFWKLDDAVRDGGGIGKRLLRFLYRRYYKKAERLRPNLCKSTANAIAELSDLERQGCDSIDRTADTFATILSSAAGESELTEDRREALCRMLYHVGRWIYIVDAYDDLADDAKTGAYNAVAARWATAGGVADDAVRGEVEMTLSHSLDAAYVEFTGCDFGTTRGFVDNVLRLGLYMVTDEVLNGRFRQRRRINDRPV